MTMVDLEDTVSQECGEAYAKMLNYDNLHDLHMKNLNTIGELSGQLKAFKGVDAQRLDLVAKNAVMWDAWDVFLLGLGLTAISVAIGLAVGAFAF